MEMSKENFCISTDSEKMDLGAVHKLLCGTYWAKKRSLDTITRSIQHSLCFSLYDGSKQIGLVRVITDYALYAYLCDVVIEESYRGQGLGQWMIQCVLDFEELQSVKKWSLITRDAQEFYKKFGFHELENPQNYMERSQ